MTDDRMALIEASLAAMLDQGIAVTNGTVTKLLERPKKFALHRFGLA